MPAATPEISVIIPAYNQGPYLREAVESVYAQTKLPAQVIVINDGSTDDTSSLLEVLAKEFPTMTIVHQQNEGLIATCHRALEMVTETFVVRLDADDKMPINFLEVLYTALQGKPEHVGFAYSSAQLFGKDTGWIMAKPWSIARLAPENYIHVSSLMRTEMARDTGYFSDALQGGYEDWDFYLTLAENGFSGVFCPDTFLWYRQKDDGGRNVLPRDKARELRAQIEERHPKIYENSGIKLRIFVWKVLRRIRHWFGKA